RGFEIRVDGSEAARRCGRARDGGAAGKDNAIPVELRAGNLGCAGGNRPAKGRTSDARTSLSDRYFHVAGTCRVRSDARARDVRDTRLPREWGQAEHRVKDTRSAPHHSRALAG